MNGTAQQTSTIIFGFDSAWTDSPKAPGAICAVAIDETGAVEFHEPQLVTFAQAIDYIDYARLGFSLSLIALDQPLVVPNVTGSRPVDKVAASLVSFVGGGVQPANRSKRGIFCDDAPIWRFLSCLNATQAPLDARTAFAGNFVVEVFPALDLPSLHDDFSTRFGAPKYNPENRRKFRIEDWRTVAEVTAARARELGVQELASWAQNLALVPKPTKADQDRLDAAICVLIGLIWRSGPEDASAFIGDVTKGYMITPISAATKERLKNAATKRGVPFSQTASEGVQTAQERSLSA